MKIQKVISNCIKHILIFFLPFVFSVFSFYAQENYTQVILKEREEFEQELLYSDEILNKDEIQNIKKLQYFEIDSNWILTADFKKDVGEIFEMPTTTERKPTYRRVGYLFFTYQEIHFQLAVYQNMELKGTAYEDYYFLPFKDSNAPEITYGGGRYLDVQFSLEDVNVVVDFNKAYNPYCVYSYRYSCPITPSENHLSVKINSGAKNPILRE